MTTTNRCAALFAAWLLAAGPALAAADEPRPAGPREAYREGYQRGYEDGFAAGLRKGEEESRAVAPPAGPTGPIAISRALYGTSSKHCDATRYVARRANGKRRYCFEVSNEMCGDPSRGDRKSLDVTYICGTLARTASANEHRTLYLDCTP
jgi:hypothetical protein